MNIKTQSLILIFLFFSLGLSTLKGEEPDKELRVYSNKQIDGPFLVDEKNLRKLNELVKKRISEVCNRYQMTYSVFFNDNSNYETKSFEVILLEENSKNQKILEINLSGQAGSPCEDETIFSNLFHGSSIKVSLSNKYDWTADSMKFDITGRDRDWVFLTSSDLSERLENMVLKYFLGPKLTSHIVVILILFPPGLFLMWIAWKSDESEKKKKDSNYVGTTFWGFLKRTGVMLFLITTPIWLFVFFITYVILSGYIENNYFPSGIFYFGEQIKEYQEIVEWRENIFWTVGVSGLLIIFSLVVGGVIKRFKKTQNHEN